MHVWSAISTGIAGSPCFLRYAGDATMMMHVSSNSLATSEEEGGTPKRRRLDLLRVRNARVRKSPTLLGAVIDQLMARS